MDIPVIYQDQDVCVISKPAGVVVNRAQSVTEPTIQDWFAQQCPESVTGEWPADWQEQIPDDFDPTYGTPEEIFKERLGMVHRLDKDTSGVLVLAKHPGSLVALLKQFKERKVKKTYQCLVHGKMAVPRDRIDLPLARSPKNPTRFAVRPAGRPAATEYRLLAEFAGLSDQVPATVRGHPTYQQGFSLLECYPETGRTHQIRVHLAHLHHPIVADTVYLGRKRQKIDTQWCPRQFLHAHTLELEHPRTVEDRSFSAPLAPDLQEVLNSSLASSHNDQ